MLELRAVNSKPGLVAAIRNLGWLAAERGARLVLNLGTGLFVARHLGPSRLGSLNYAFAVVSLLSTLAALGLEAGARRDLINRPRDASAILASAIFLRLGAGALCFLGLGVAILGGVFGRGESARLMTVFGLILLQPGFQVPDLWFQANLQAKVSVLAQMLALVVTAALRVVLVLQDAPLIAFAWVTVAEGFIAALVLIGFARNAGLRLGWAHATAVEMRRIFLESWPLMFAGLAVVVYMRIDEVMLRTLVGVEAVGIYGAATRISEIWYFLPMAISTSLLPALLRARSRDPGEYQRRLQHYYDLSAALAYGLAVPIALLAPWLVQVAFGAAFRGAGPILAVHIWASIFVFLGVARSQWLVNEGLQKFSLVATAAGAVSNILLNLYMIPRWSGLGAAYATVVSYALAGWLASYFHPRARATAIMQTRAVLFPITGWRYLRGARTSSH